MEKEERTANDGRPPVPKDTTEPPDKATTTAKHEMIPTPTGPELEMDNTLDKEQPMAKKALTTTPGVLEAETTTENQQQQQYQQQQQQQQQDTQQAPTAVEATPPAPEVENPQRKNTVNHGEEIHKTSGSGTTD